LRQRYVSAARWAGTTAAVSRRVQGAGDVGSVDRIMSAAEQRPYLNESVERGLERVTAASAPAVAR